MSSFQFLPHINASAPAEDNTFLIPVRQSGDQKWLDMEIIASDQEGLLAGLRAANEELTGWVDQNPVVAIAEVHLSIVRQMAV